MWYSCPGNCGGGISDWEGGFEKTSCIKCGRPENLTRCDRCTKRYCLPCIQDFAYQTFPGRKPALLPGRLADQRDR